MEKLVISFSGGRTSAYMARWIQLNMPDSEKTFIFANTGQEDERTLAFVNECDKRWGLGVVWIEADVSQERGKATRHKIVSFETASRKGEPFEDVIKKYGIPNQAYPHCTRELKLQPITSYVRENGLQDALMCVGIRADEIDRMRHDARDAGIVYPLVSWHPKTKQQVVEWWRNQDFDLAVPERLGNCTWCWKKTVRKHLTNIAENASVYDFPARMESLYGLSGHNVDGNKRVFFRNHTSTKQLIDMASQPFSPFVESHEYQYGLFDEAMDTAAGCSESCEPF